MVSSSRFPLKVKGEKQRKTKIYKQEMINSLMNTMTWEVTGIDGVRIKRGFFKRRFLNPVLIEGLPGIGNVAKISVDFLVQELKAKPILEFTSKTMPASVFVKENNLVDLPHIYLYHKRIKNRDFFFLAGDFQPTEEVSAYELANCVINTFKKLKGKFIITLGGIGLSLIPKKPRVYCTSYSEEIINRFLSDKRLRGVKVERKLYGVVGPIMGAAGLLVGLAKKNKIKAITFLAETYGHPLFLGVMSAKELVVILNKKFELGINTKKLDKQIESFEKSLMRIVKAASKPKKKSFEEETNYIG